MRRCLCALNHVCSENGMLKSKVYVIEGKLIVVGGCLQPVRNAVHCAACDAILCYCYDGVVTPKRCRGCGKALTLWGAVLDFVLRR